MPVAKSNEQQVKIVLKADAKAFTAGMQAASKAAREAANASQSAMKRAAEQNVKEQKAGLNKMRETMRDTGKDAKNVADQVSKIGRAGTDAGRNARAGLQGISTGVAKDAKAAQSSIASIGDGAAAAGKNIQSSLHNSVNAATSNIRNQVAATGEAGKIAGEGIASGVRAGANKAADAVAGIGAGAAQAGKATAEGIKSGLSEAAAATSALTSAQRKQHTEAVAAMAAASQQAAQRAATANLNTIRGSSAAVAAATAAGAAQAASAQIRSHGTVVEAVAAGNAAMSRSTRTLTATQVAAYSAAASASVAGLNQRYNVFTGMTRAETAAYRASIAASREAAGSITGIMQRASQSAAVGWRDYASAASSSFKSVASGAADAFKSSRLGSSIIYSDLVTGARAAASQTADAIRTPIAGAFTSVRERSTSVVSGLASDFRQAGTEAKNLASNILSNKDALDKIASGAGITGAALLAPFALAVKQYADFDAAMAGVQAATHETAGNMEKLRTAAINAGADTKYSGKEAAQGIEELAKAGVDTTDILSGGLNGALSLAAAGNIQVGDAAELAATAMTQFKLKGADLEHVADLLAAGAGKAQGSVGDLGYALKQSGLVASQTGLTIEETTGTLAAFASAGLIGSDAGTSFKVMLQKLQNPSKQAAGLMKEYGISLYDSTGKFKGITAVAADLKRGLQDLTPAQRDAAMATIFGSDAVRAASVLYTAGGEGIQEWIDKTNDAGYAASTAAIQQNNLAGDIEKLGGAIDSAVLKSSGGINEVLRGITQFVTGIVDFIGKLPAPFLAVNLAVVGLTGVVLLTVAAAAKMISAYQTVKGTLASYSAAARGATAATEGLAASSSTAAAGGSKLGGFVSSFAKIAGTAALAAEGVTLFISAFNTDFKAPSVDKMNSALKTTGGNLDVVNQQFKDMGGKATWAFLGMEDQVPKVNGLGEALVRLKSDAGDAMEGFSQWVSHTAGAKVGADAFKEAVNNLDDSLSQLYGQNQDDAVAFFQSIVRETDAASDAQGKARYSAEEYMKAFPKLKEAVEGYAASMNVSLSEDEKYQAMLGNYPPKLEEARRKQEELKHALEVQKNALEEGADGMSGLSGEAKEMANWVGAAGSAVEDLDKNLKVLGSGFASSTKQMADYYKSMDDLADAIKKNNAAYDSTSKTFDQTTKAGQKLNAAFASMAQEGVQAAAAVGRQGGSYEDVKNHIHGVIDTLRQSAIQMGLTSDQADELVRSIYGIPKNISIETWADTTASRVITSLTQDAERVPGEITIGTQVFGVDHATGQLKYLREVGDAADKDIDINAKAHTGQANNALLDMINNTFKVPRRTDTTAVARTGQANANVNSYRSNLAQIPRTKTTELRVVRTTFNEESSGSGHMMKWRAPRARGGMVPGYATGGVIPGRAPLSPWVDNIPAVTNQGMQLMVRSGEFIVNEQATRRNRSLLEQINAGYTVRGYATGGYVQGARSYTAPDAPVNVGEQVAEAIRSWQPVVRIGTRDFYGLMRESTIRNNR